VNQAQTPGATSLAPESVLAALEAREADDLAALRHFVSIPSVSTEPSHAPDVRRAATYLSERLRSAGLHEVEIVDTPGHPVVLAAWRGQPSAPTILVYGHYDVQPPDPVDAWHSPPFEVTERGGRLYARGISDDKAPLSIALDTVAAYLQVSGALPLNVVFVFEGEEEVGSPNLPALLDARREQLAADLVVSADGGMWLPDHPTTIRSARGLASLELRVSAATKDLHSGRHGGGLANPLHAIASMIASLHDAAGRVAVEGFYEGVRPIPAALAQTTRELPFDDAAYLAETGAPATVGEVGFSTLERQWYRPTLELNGLWGGYTGAGSKTVLPHEAHAKISCRLVDDQDPERVLDAIERHLQRVCPPGVRLDVARGVNGARAYVVADDHPGLQAVQASLRATYGVEPWLVGMGGSVPICAAFKRVLACDTVFFSFAVGDEDIHAPNEFFRLRRWREGRRAWADLVARLPGALAHG